MNGEKLYKYIQVPMPFWSLGLIFAFQIQDNYEN